MNTKAIAILLFASLCGACGSPGTDSSPGGRTGTAPAQSGYAPIGELRMYYEVRGAGPPLVLLHGGGSGIESTFGRIRSDLERSYRVIAVEQQGHGRTADIDRPFSFEQMADDTARLMAHLGVSNADVFGFSNGGNVAMQLALRHPDRVRKLVVAAAFYRNEGLDPQVRASFSKPPRIEDMPPALREEYQRIAPRPGDLPRQAAKLMQMMSGFKDWPAADLRRIRAPTLVMIGDRDIVRPEHAVEMMRTLPQGRLAILPGSHGTYIGEASTPPTTSQVPRLAAALVQEFLAAPTP